MRLMERFMPSDLSSAGIFDHTLHVNSLAFSLFPGLIAFVKQKGDKLQTKCYTVAQWLVQIVTAEDTAGAMIRFAADWIQNPPHEQQRKERKRRTPAEERTYRKRQAMRRIEQQTGKHHWSDAARAANALGEQLKADEAALAAGLGDQPLPPPAQLTPERIAALISELHPAADERDILPPLDPAVVPLQVTADDVAKGIERLNICKAAGSDGWTNSLVKALYIMRTQSTNTSDATYYLDTLTGWINSILKGDMNTGLVDLLLVSRVALIPKPGREGQYRPLGLASVHYRMATSIVNAKAAPHIGPRLQPPPSGSRSPRWRSHCCPAPPDIPRSAGLWHPTTTHPAIWSAYPR
jgi:hypothetical protein